MDFKNALTLQGTPVSLTGHTHDEYALDTDLSSHESTASHPSPSNVNPQAVTGTLIGTSLDYARADHRHGNSYGTPVALGAAANAGSGSTAARANHVHPWTGLALDTHTHDTYATLDFAAATYFPLTGGTISGDLTVAGNITMQSTGPLVFKINADTDNATETDTAVIQIRQDGEIVGVDIGIDSNNSIYLQKTYDQADFLLKDAAGSTIGRILSTADEGSGNGLDADTVDGQHASAFSLTGHEHDSVYVNEADHTLAQHTGLGLAASTDLPSPATSSPANTASSSGTVGTSLLYARQDHRHGFSTGTPVALATTASAGSASSLARSNHVHPTTGLATSPQSVTISVQETAPTSPAVGDIWLW